MLDRALRVCDKFREEKKNHFFTEADARQMFVEKFISGGGVNRHLVHLEYPTPYRTSVEGWFAPTDNPKARRGHYDLLVFSQWFYEALEEKGSGALMGRDIEQVVQEWRKILENGQKEAPFALAVEFKYITRSWATVDERRGVVRDLSKLWFSRRFPERVLKTERIALGAPFVAAGLCVVFLKEGDQGAPNAWGEETSTFVPGNEEDDGVGEARQLLSGQWEPDSRGRRVHWYKKGSQFSLGLVYLPVGEPKGNAGEPGKPSR